MPLGCLASDAILHGTMTRDGNNALWAKIQAPTAQKRQLCVQHRIGIYLKSWMDASLLKKNANLKNDGAPKSGMPGPRHNMLAIVLFLSAYVGLHIATMRRQRIGMHEQHP